MSSTEDRPAGDDGALAAAADWGPREDWSDWVRSFRVTTLKGGREGIFWQTARTTRKTRPGMRLPTRQSAVGVLEIIVDTRERYAWKFERQQVSIAKRALPVGDYAVEVRGEVVGAVVAGGSTSSDRTTTDGGSRRGSPRST